MFTRREFLTFFATRVALPGTVAVAAYGAYEAKRPRVHRVETTLRHLPSAFDGVTIAFLSDTHHGPFVPVSYLEEVVAMANALQPDLVLLGGDYVQRARGPRRIDPNARYLIEPGIGALAGLQAPLGKYAVLGNHDHRTDPSLTRSILVKHGFVDLTNANVRLEREGAQLVLAGMDDCRVGRPSLAQALSGVKVGDACLLLTHNPDCVERITDPRVDLVVSGHTHGGQVVLPWVGAPIVPSRYGQKYRAGLVQGPSARVFVTTGVGTIGPPVRLGARPEVALIKLRCGAARNRG